MQFDFIYYNNVDFVLRYFCLRNGYFSNLIYYCEYLKLVLNELLGVALKDTPYSKFEIVETVIIQAVIFDSVIAELVMTVLDG